MSAAGTNPAASRSPGVGAALRAAARDFFEQSWRLVAANLAWGLALLAVLAALSVTPLALLIVPLLAVPTVGVYRVAALAARGEPVSVADGFRAWWRLGARALTVGAALTLGVAVLATNVGLGLTMGELVGWGLATLAAWGLVGTAIVTVVIWPLLADPWRERAPFREVVRLGLLLALAFPLRFLTLAVLLGGILMLSSLAVVAVLAVALGLVASISCRYVLAAADRFWPPAAVEGSALVRPP